MGGQATAFQGAVQGGGDVWNGVQQGAVQVKYDSFDHGVLPPG